MSQESAVKQNIDQSEIDKFSQLAHNWWDLNGDFKPLHEINPLRLGFISQHAALEGQSVLDVGCGGGILSEAMAKAGATVTGADMAKKSLQIAQLHALEGGLNIEYKCVSVEDLAVAMPAAFDVVTCMEMIEHVPDPASVIRACTELAKPGGWVFLSTLNRNLKSYVQAVIGAEYVLGLMPKGTHDYKKFIKPSEMVRMCRHVGLSLVDQSGLTYSPLTKRYKLVDDLSVNYMMAFRKPLI
ncbi:MAG: bifunctional 2-polyprenyl-6-hydroxyphenol methylase/3-demethylubiquinol 3-O-methyltransferase UbiG [Neisseriaceae bacterium]|nr:bifunctional 2-polyprenyl-6-hydroxyphenol methylase/3-demethylubiquinol 3-O-methyltransferase UbiG [Neisseriaceae bacterium]MBP6862042.1 bifunctional 2-polyprenyl-6-hydroxyphenol methylase/3-demethylubiquinol 3-O-methyltransferase UbiG [Neisseriaceae bacterium]